MIAAPAVILVLFAVIRLLFLLIVITTGKEELEKEAKSF
jgi:hypothetical protein